MKKLGKKAVKSGGDATVNGYCSCKCNCKKLKLNASNAAPRWMTLSLIEPSSV